MSMMLGPEDVSLLERCPHFRGCYVQTSMESVPVKMYYYYRENTEKKHLSFRLFITLHILQVPSLHLQGQSCQQETTSFLWCRIRKPMPYAGEGLDYKYHSQCCDIWRLLIINTSL